MPLRSGRRYSPYDTAYRIGRFATKAYLGYRHARGRSVLQDVGSVMTRRRNITSGQGVTSQFDKKLIYRKKRAPRRKRRAWGKFSRKVKAVAEKSLGARTIVRNEEIPTDQSGTGGGIAGIQATTEIALYSSTYPALPLPAKPWLNDLDALTDNETAGDDTSSMLFQSGILDMTVANYSLDENAAGMPVEVDVYEITAGRKFDDLSPGQKGLTQVFEEAASKTATIGSATSMEITDRGVTPWDLTLALQQYRIKIWKKSKYQLPFGGSFSYQVRDPKRHKINMQTIKDMDGVNVPGVTRFVFIITKPIVGAAVGDGAVIRLRTGTTRKFLYKYNSISGKADGIL